MKPIPADQAAEFQALVQKLGELSQRGGYSVVVLAASMSQLSWSSNVHDEMLAPIAKIWLRSLENPNQAPAAPVLTFNTRGGTS